MFMTKVNVILWLIKLDHGYAREPMIHRKKYKLHIVTPIIFVLILACFVNLNITTAAVIKEPRLNVRTLSLAKDTTYKLRIYNTKKSYTTKFESDDTSIVSIRKPTEKACTLRPRSNGTTYITATITDEEDTLVTELKCKVTISPPAISFKFAKKKVKLDVGQSRKPKTITKPNITAEQPKYCSDNPLIATVSSTGTIVGLSVGQTVIRASIANGRQDSIIVIVSSSSDSNATIDASAPPTAVPTATPTPSSSPTLAPSINKKNPISMNDRVPVEPKPPIYENDKISQP